MCDNFSMIKTGITGNIACGKSVAYEIIKSAGYIVIDCDDIIKAFYDDEKFVFEVSKVFPQIIRNNKIDLINLSSNIFSDKKFKADYESFIFPKVKEKIIEFYKDNENAERVFVVAPLIFEAGFENLFDKIIFISADENIRKERLISRKSMLSEIAEKVINSQMKEEAKIPRCDYVIKNNGTLDEFKVAVNTLINNI